MSTMRGRSRARKCSVPLRHAASDARCLFANPKPGAANHASAGDDRHGGGVPHRGRVIIADTQHGAVHRVRDPVACDTEPAAAMEAGALSRHAARRQRKPGRAFSHLADKQS